MLHYLRTFLFSLALVLSLTQVPAVAMAQTDSHQMMDHSVAYEGMNVHSMTEMSLPIEMGDMHLVQDECTGSTSCAHCVTNIACMNHCAASVAVPSFPIYRLPESLPDQYVLTVLPVDAFFFNQPNTPPPKRISFS